MRCAGALSTSPDTATATQEVLDQLRPQLSDAPIDLAVAFASPHHAEALAGLADHLFTQGAARHCIGCTGESILGTDREIEAEPALALWGITAADLAARPVRLAAESDIQALRSAYRPESPGVLIALGDPFSFESDRWLFQLQQEMPGLRIVGGMASAGHQPGANRLLLDGEVYNTGAVAIYLDGPIQVRTIVSQGCRPVGRTMIITKAERNLIKELSSQPAVDLFRDVFLQLDQSEQALVRNGLHIGRVINEYQDQFHRGDFLVRNVLGADESGAIAVNDVVRVGQTVQFHVRDADTADEDLRGLLSAARGEGIPRGALIFTCNGRGTRLFPRPHHDIATLHELLGPIPAAGFFAMGEFGPVGGQNFTHGFTASIALFEEPVA